MSNKLQLLKEYFSRLPSAAIAFSSGVDSTFMLKVAHEVLGDKVLAVTVSSGVLTSRELKEAEDFCSRFSIPHTVIKADEMSVPGFRQNPKDRCYLCKRNFFEKIISAAKEKGIETVCEGSNLDDLRDYRPGLKAIAELGIKSPLRECSLTKNEIRQYSKELDLPTWNKPALACLASRIPYGEEITEEKLRRIEKAEQLLLDLGFKQMRVRLHSSIARIETPEEDIDLLLRHRKTIVEKFKSYGFDYITMDLQGYRTGSLNEVLSRNEKTFNA